MGWEDRGEGVMFGYRPQLMGDQEWLNRVQTEKADPVARGVHW